MDEQSAISLLKAGDMAGLEQLVRKYQVEAVQTAYLILGDRQLAQDVAQTSFLRVAEKIHQFRDDLPFRPWFLRIVANHSIRASSRAARFLSLDAAQEQDTEPIWLRDSDPGPEELVNAAENSLVVWEALQQLRPVQRAAIVMRYFLDMRDGEIASELNRSLSSIKWSIHVAKRRLRSLLTFGGIRRSKKSGGKHGRGIGGEQ
jgi:RNA polymerase sigma-70 factor (ECF subfamily)